MNKKEFFANDGSFLVDYRCYCCYFKARALFFCFDFELRTSIDKATAVGILRLIVQIEATIVWNGMEYV